MSGVLAGQIVRSGRYDDLMLAMRIASAALVLAERAGADYMEVAHLRQLLDRLQRAR